MRTTDDRDEEAIREGIAPWADEVAAMREGAVSLDRLWSLSLVTDPEQIKEYTDRVNQDTSLQVLEAEICGRGTLDACVWFAAHWLWIVNKEAKLHTLTLNDPQRLYADAQTEYDIILKARKEGMSTYTLAEYFWRALFRTYTNTAIMTHKGESTAELWQKVDLFDQKLPDWLRPNRRRTSRKELYYDVGPDGRSVEARYLVATAGSREWGRGGDLDQVLLSELAFYQRPSETLAAVLNATRKNARVRIETTANGRNFFYDEWKLAKDGKSRFRPFFLSWFRDPSNTEELDPDEEIEYDEEEQNLVHAFGLTAEQIKWRRVKMMENREKFFQEFPENDEDPFTVKTGRVYPTFSEQIHVFYPPYPKIPDDWRRYRAVDFGHTNPFATLWIAVNKDAEVFIYDRIYERGKRTEEHVPLLRAKSRGKRFQWTVCDHDADQRADLRAGGIETVKALKQYSLEFGFDIVRKLLQVKRNGRPSVFVFSDCEEVIDEFLNYVYPETAGETQSEHPKKEWDHAMDALRYFAVRWSRETGHFWPEVL